MLKFVRLAAGMLVAAALVVGCSGDKATAPGAGDGQVKTVIAGDIDPGVATFEYAADAPGDPSPGSFKIRGGNLRYEADPGALLADIALVNDATVDFPGPARLVFMQLLPDGVTILNADNADTALGAGAMFEFAFASGDTLWRAGTATEPRTIQFGVAPGTSLGFVARVLVGDMPVDGGTIGGLVWRDADGDGLVGDGERGVPGVELLLRAGSGGESDPAIMHALTGRDGRYRFVALASGHYTVSLAPGDQVLPTTAPSMEVLLVEYEGSVSDFLDADFGVRRAAAPDTMPCLAVGSCLNAKGDFMTEPDRLASDVVDVCRTEGDCDDHEYDCDDCGQDKTGGGDCWGILAGPVTDVDLANHAVAIMGTWVHLSHDAQAKNGRDDDPAVGMRMRASVAALSGADGDSIVACRVVPWHGHGDRVRGYVQEIVRDGDALVGVRVLNTLVTVPDSLVCAEDEQN